MRVNELISLLEQVDPSLVVVLASDEEGNSYHELGDVGGGHNSIFVRDGHAGEIHLRHLTHELQAQGYTEEDVYDGDDGRPAVVLWP